MNRYVILGWLALACAAPAWSQFPPAKRVIAVTGRAEVQVAPDTVDVQLGVEHEAPTVREAMEQTGRAMQAIVDRLRQDGVPDRSVRTAALRLVSVHEGGLGTNRPRRLVGYTARNTLTVTLSDVTRAGPIVAAAVDAGANQVEGMEFRVANDAPLREQALKAALAKARDTARAIATEMKVSLGRVESVNQSFYDMPGGGFMGGGYGGAPPVPVQPGEITIGVHVNVQYQIGKG
jgi:uncharacterized protein YggE